MHKAAQIFSAPKPALTLVQRLLPSHAHPEQRLRDGGRGEGLGHAKEKSKETLLQVSWGVQ